MTKIGKRLRSARPGTLTHKERRDLFRTCASIAKAAERLDSSTDSLALLEVCVCNVVAHLDKTTRDNLFTAVNVIIDSKQTATQQSLASAKMLELLVRDRDRISTNLIVKNIIDLLLKNTSKRHIKPTVREEILKSIIGRLMMELPHETVKQVINQFQVAGVDRDDQGFMYG